MNFRISALVLAIIFLTISCTKDKKSYLDEEVMNSVRESSPNNDAAYYIMPESGDYAALPNQDVNNPITKEKVNLGRLLFFETGLAQHSNNDACYETYSCATCHVPSKGFLPGRFQGIADGASGFGNQGDTRVLVDGYSPFDIDAQGTRPLTVMNATYVTNTLWSGTFGANDKNIGTEDKWIGSAEINHTGLSGLEAQNIENFELHRMAIDEKVLDGFAYRGVFDFAFPDIPKSERYTTTTASFALSAYLRSLLTNEAPFQEFLKGDSEAITESQKLGAMLFFGKAGCADCHNGPAFSNMNFYALGTADLYERGGLNTSADDVRIRGRAAFTGDEKDMFKFKVPQLYNLQSYETFFHGSSKESIEEVIKFKLVAQSENTNVPQEMMDLSAVYLSPEEQVQLIDFLSNALYDDNMDRYVPTGVLSGYCFPNNDPQSRIDIGCD